MQHVSLVLYVCGCYMRVWGGEGRGEGGACACDLTAVCLRRHVPRTAAGGARAGKEACMGARGPGPGRRKGVGPTLTLAARVVPSTCVGAAAAGEGACPRHASQGLHKALDKAQDAADSPEEA